MFDFLYRGIGLALNFVTELVGNYGLAIIIMGVLIKLVSFPFSYKSQKSMRKMTLVKPLEEKIRREYPDDKKKQQEEIMNMYQKEGVNPMGGCLPNIVPLVVVLFFFEVMRRPLTFLLGIGKDMLVRINDVLSNPLGIAADVIADPVKYQNAVYQSQIQLSNAMSTHGSEVAAAIPELSSPFGINYNMFGLNLSFTPSWPWDIAKTADPNQYWLLLIIPLFVIITGLLVSFFSKKFSPTPGQAGGNGMKIMMYGLPFITFFISFTVPASLGIYWTVTNLLSIAQTYTLHKLLPPIPEGSTLDDKGNIVEIVNVSNKQRKRMEKATLKAARERATDETDDA